MLLPGALHRTGTNAVRLRCDGAQWTPLDPGTDQPLSAVAGSGPGAFFIAGSGGAILRAEAPAGP